jgi:hypothetical protein
VCRCDELRSFLESYGDRDPAIERLELAIMDERLEAMLGAREFAVAAGRSEDLGCSTICSR